jgi:hypothetical protein
MGFISAFGDRGIHMMRRGLAYQGGISPEVFVANVDEARYAESWCEGLVFQNPHPLVPLPVFFNARCCSYNRPRRTIVSSHPPFFPVGSMTFSHHKTLTTHE